MRRLLVALLAATAVAAFVGVARAGPLTVTGSLYTPPVTQWGITTSINLASITVPSAATVTGAGYTVSFSVPAGQGVVQNSSSGAYAVPVAGVTSGNLPEYLTAGYGSALTTNIAASGNYLSTGIGTITLTFTSDQNAFAMLWGSIDTFNSVTVLEGSTTLGTVTGTDAGAVLGNGFLANGGQGPGGSGYIIITSSTPFNTITFSSTTNSFEFTGIIGSDASIGIPEPASLPLFAAGLFGLALVARRRA